MNFINFGQWDLVFITYFGTSQNDLFFAELAMQLEKLVCVQEITFHIVIAGLHLLYNM